MSPIAREYLVYAIAVACGFAFYLVLERVFGVDFFYAMLGGFVIIHGAVLLGRRFLNRN